MSDPAPAEFAIVELMGHRRRAGRIAEVERFGTKLLRIDIPNTDGETTEFYGGGSIYALRPCTEDVAREAARQIGDLRPVAPVTYRLPPMAPPEGYEIDGDGGDEEPV